MYAKGSFFTVTVMSRTNIIVCKIIAVPKLPCLCPNTTANNIHFYKMSYCTEHTRQTPFNGCLKHCTPLCINSDSTLCFCRQCLPNYNALPLMKCTDRGEKFWEIFKSSIISNRIVRPNCASADSVCSITMHYNCHS